MQRIAFITQPNAIHAFLESVGLPADPPLDGPLQLDDDAAA